MRRFLRLWRRLGRERPTPAHGGMGLSTPFLEAPRVLTLQKKLHELGIPVPQNGVFDEPTAAAVAEAKRRMRVTFTEDTADRATPELMGRLGL